jgi:hypothetical protein
VCDRGNRLVDGTRPAAARIVLNPQIVDQPPSLGRITPLMLAD